MTTQTTVGILGGMGPYATLAFYRSLLDITPANKDWDHLRVILDVNPHIPSRSRHHLYGEPSPVPAMIDSCLRLQAYPVDFIVIPCNSASCFIPDVQASVTLPIVNIIRIAVEALRQKVAVGSRIAVLGSVITYDRRTYEPFLQAHGLTYVHHPKAIQRRAESIIEQLKLTRPHSEVVAELTRLRADLRETCEIDAMIYGCTEFGCIPGEEAGMPVIDSSRALARRTLELAIGTTVIPQDA